MNKDAGNITTVDQMGNKVLVPSAPLRIVSLVPSQTELLFDMGLDNHIVGITKFCVHPKEKVRSKTKIGGTKKFNFDRINELHPNLIIGNKEENYKAGINFLQQHYPVWMSDINTTADNLAMIKSLGHITGRASFADKIINSINQSLSTFQKTAALSVLYLIWKNPLMAAGSGTYIDHMLSVCGLKNCMKHKTRYPELDSEAVKSLNPQLVFLSSEPYPFQEKHIAELQHVFPLAKIVLVDGEMFSWYGSRTIQAFTYFKSLINTLV